MKDPKEAKAITQIIIQLDNLFDNYGDGLSDKEYIEKPAWQGVVKAAQDALRVFNV